MDAPLYTLIGALGGVLVTQVANYFLESKKGKNAKEAKKLELDKYANMTYSKKGD